MFSTSTRSRRHLVVLVAVISMIAVEAVVAVTSAWVAFAARGRVIDAGELSGTAPHTMIVLGAKADEGVAGTYLRERLDVAARAHRDGTAAIILISGNDADDAGNEVQTMRAHLEAAGVPSADIVDDPLGLNTNATCRRAATVYGIRSATIVTQNFHVARAVMLCRAWGIDVTGVVAPCGPCSLPSLARNQIREALGSRPRAVVDALRAGR